MSTPRHVDGRPLIPLGPGWVALTTHDGRNLTNPTPGYVWLHMTLNGDGTVMFNPDNSDDHYRVVQTVTTRGTGHITFGTDAHGPLTRKGWAYTVFVGDVFTIDTRWVEEVMA